MTVYVYNIKFKRAEKLHKKVVSGVKTGISLERVSHTFGFVYILNTLVNYRFL